MLVHVNGNSSNGARRHRVPEVLLTLVILLLPMASAQTGSGAAALADAGHPRLWVTANRLPTLRSWANDANPIYAQGLAVLAEEARIDMDAGFVPAQDDGSVTWLEFPSEMYAELFAFMSLIEPDPVVRDDYAERARTLLMHVIDRVTPGQVENAPFRDPEFATSDRSRWWGEGFALTVDWIYPYLSSAEKESIRRVFLRWAEENESAEITTFNHPEPRGVLNDPILVEDRVAVRWSANNYFTAHMRNLGLMALAFDPADDPGGELHAHLASATGAWLYRLDHMLRTDGSGGLGAEGFEYSPQSLGYAAQFLLALETSGQADPDAWGPQVVMADAPFWEDVVPAYLHSLSPEPTVFADIDWLGATYQPAWYGEGQEYFAADFIELFGPLGLYREATGDLAGLEAIRWIQTHVPPGGAGRLVERIEDAEAFRDAILYFLLFDPTTGSPDDPRPSLPKVHFAPGVGRLLARTDWTEDASWFTYMLGWTTIDHRHGDGNSFELYRAGEWLTKERTGYGPNVSASDYHNTVALENDRPDHFEASDYRYPLWQRGSQWIYVASGDGRYLATSFGDDFVYVLGDATDLYNSEYEGATDIVHASRSIVWLQPDHIVVLDRTESRTDGRFKRFWLNLTAEPDVDGARSVSTTPSGQHLFVTTLLPTDAVLTGQPVEPLEEQGEPAGNDPITHRLRVEAPNRPRHATFLHVLQGADPQTQADPATTVTSTSGTAYVGAVVAGTAVLFPADLGGPFESTTYQVPEDTLRHLITGLEPGASYDVDVTATASGAEVTVRLGSTLRADGGGVVDVSF